ncbi:MAG: GNAT family N-acetyltransferase [Capsulimonadaceae bacterium]|nr:GNAT family N-acetyltransferase [Capsulimonadaceae bacterium]
MWKVDVVTRTGDFEALKDEWTGLADRSPSSTVFQTYEWLHAWWLEVGSHLIGRKLHIVTVRTEAGELSGIAPLMTSYWQGTPLRRLTFLGSGASDYHDLIAVPDSAEDVSAEVYRHLAAYGGWSIGDFSQLREGGLWRSLPPAPESGLIYSDFVLEKCPYLPYPRPQEEAWDLLLKRYSKKMRSHIGYYDRKLRSIYTVQCGVVENKADLDDAMGALFELHLRRWNKRWLPGVLGGARTQAFHRRVASSFLERGWLRLHYLLLDDDYQAILYCFAYRDRTCYYQGGFEPTLARLSLGSVLTASAIRRSIDEGRLEFDFLRGDEPYKERWTQGCSRENLRRVIARRGPIMLPLAGWAHHVENMIEMRFKDFMHHVYSRESGKKREREQEGEPGK